MSSDSSSSTSISSKGDPIELEKKSHSKSSSSSSAKPVHEAEQRRVSKELIHEEAKDHKHEHGKHEHGKHEHAHKEHAEAAHKTEIVIDKKKPAAAGKVWVGTDDHPQSDEVALSDMTAAHLAQLFGFKTIKYLVSHDHDYLAPDEHGSFVSRVKYGMSYLIAGLEEYEDKCIRCRKLFNLTQKKTCRYHPGERVLVDLSKGKKKKKKAKDGDIPLVLPKTEVWSCCKEEEIISSGCCKVKGHVGMLQKNYKPKPLGEEPLDPQFDTKNKSRQRKKREAKLEKYKPWEKAVVDTKGTVPTANTNQKPKAVAPKPEQEFKLKEKPVEEVKEVKEDVIAVPVATNAPVVVTDNKSVSSSDESSASGSSDSSSSPSSSTTKSD